MWLAEPPLQDPDEAADATEEAEAGPANPWAELPVAERLSDVLQRLRTEYFYCIFCGCQVGSRAQLICAPPSEARLMWVAPSSQQIVNTGGNDRCS